MLLDKKFIVSPLVIALDSVSSPDAKILLAVSASDIKKCVTVPHAAVAFVNVKVAPFCLEPAVALGKFDESTCLLRGKQLLDLRVDNNWINQIVSLREVIG